MTRPGADPAPSDGDLARRRRRAVILGIGVVGLLTVAGFLFWARPVAKVTETTPVEEALAALVAPAPAVEGLRPGPERPAGSGSAPAAATLQVCGRPPLPRPRGPEEPEWRGLAQTVLSEQMQWTARMLAHPDARVVAAGWLQVERQGQLALRAVHHAERAACRADRGCATEADARLGARLRDLAQRARDPLASLAVASGDAAIYAHAARACAREPRVGGACALVSTAQWTRIEPDNIEAWLQLADEAQARNDAAAVAEALHRAALAPRHQTHLALRFDALQATVVADTHLASRRLALSDLIGASLAAGRPGLSTVLAHCHRDRLADANRQQVCHALAEAFVERGATLQELGLGLALAGRLGWPEDRMVTLRTEERTMLALGEAALATDQPLGCEVIERLESQLADRSRLGELAAARAQLALADASARRAALADWADRDAKAHSGAAAWSAASAASAASGASVR